MPYPKINRFKPNDFQRKLLAACFAYGLVVATTAVRTGKTGSVAVFHRTQAKHNPGVTGIWLVESYKWYKRVAYPVCKELFGHEAIWHGTEHTWTWPKFGYAKVIVCTYQDLDSIEGITAGWGSIDEYQNVGLDAYEVLLPRISDKRAKYPTILITGLPTYDSWADDLAETVENAKHFTGIGTDVNAANIHIAFIDRLKEGLSPAEFKRRTQGLKPLPEGRVFSEWVPQEWMPGVEGENGNLIDYRYKQDYPLYLEWDFGARRAACLFNQEHKKYGVDILLDEYNPDDTSTEAMCIHLRDLAVPRHLAGRGDTRYLLDAIYCDPAGDSTQTATGLYDIKIIKQYFPGVPIKFTFGKLRRMPVGIELCNSRILNAAGKRRQLMTFDLWERGLKDKRQGEGYTKGKRGRSIALSLLRTRYPEDKSGRALSNDPIDCPIDSHCSDAWRYGVINRHGKPVSGQFPAR